MRPDHRDFDDEIRGHLALAIKERVERGEDPETARRAALDELGYVPDVRDSMRRVWYSRWFDSAAALAREMRIGLRSLLRSKGLAATVVITLALGIGANAAIFSVVRGVLLRPLVNDDEERLLYIRQSAPGIGAENTTFSVPEIDDFKTGAKTISAFGDFSTVEFAMTGLGSEPRMVRAGVVGGSFFEVMGLRPVLGRLLTPQDDGPEAAGAAVLTYRFWTSALDGNPGVIGTTIRLGPRTATVIGVLEPSVPYPADTEIIANVVTSPHHLGATMTTSRTHRMTELFGRLAPGASVDMARAELTANLMPHWSFDGASLYFLQRGSALSMRRVGVLGGESIELGSWADGSAAEVDPHGRSIAYLRTSGGEPVATMIRNLATGREAQLDMVVSGPRWSADAETIVGWQRVSTSSGQAPDAGWSRALSCHVSRATCHVLVEPGFVPVVAPGGTRILFLRQAASGQGVRELWSVRPDGEDARQIAVLRIGLDATFDVSRRGEVVFVQHRETRAELWQADLR